MGTLACCPLLPFSRPSPVGAKAQPPRCPRGVAPLFTLNPAASLTSISFNPGFLNFGTIDILSWGGRLSGAGGWGREAGALEDV